VYHAFSSGFLTSDSRLTTANHNVGKPLRSDLGDDALVVTFGGEYQIDTNDQAISSDEATGYFVRDSEPYNDYPSGDDLNYDTKSGVHEENPLLANRLFALGLRSWAKRLKKSKRDTLREHWPFEIDGTRSSQANDLRWSIDTDGDGSKEEGRLDVLVLKAREQTGLETGNLLSGSFPLNRPGVFFQQQSYVDVTEDTGFCSPEPDDPLYMAHFNNWPESQEKADQVSEAPLVSNPGYTDGVYGCDPNPWGQG